MGNCLSVDGSEEFSVVYDDLAHSPAPDARFKLLWANGSVSTSFDGLTWAVGERWCKAAMDPGISVFRESH